MILNTIYFVYKPCLVDVSFQFATYMIIILGFLRANSLDWLDSQGLSRQVCSQ